MHLTLGLRMINCTLAHELISYTQKVVQQPPAPYEDPKTEQRHCIWFEQLDAMNVVQTTVGSVGDCKTQLLSKLFKHRMLWMTPKLCQRSSSGRGKNASLLSARAVNYEDNAHLFRNE